MAIEYRCKLRHLKLYFLFKASTQVMLKIQDFHYTSTSKKAGALLEETKILFAYLHNHNEVDVSNCWRENVLAKSSRSRSKYILEVLNKRYLQDREVGSAIANLVINNCPTEVLDKILYFHTARSDRLLYDVVITILYPMYESGLRDIRTAELASNLTHWNSNTWSSTTVIRVSRGILATLRDFGVLTGKVHKRIAPVYLPIYAFAYIAFYLKQLQPSVHKLMELSDWQLFFLAPIGVEKLLFEAHQQGILEYHVAGSVTRLTFPVSTLPEYATFLTQR
jgi:hypothetical protein